MNTKTSNFTRPSCNTIAIEKKLNTNKKIVYI